MSTRSPQFDTKQAHAYAELLNARDSHRFGWAVKPLAGGWHEKPLASFADIIEQVRDIDLSNNSVFICPAPRNPSSTSRKGLDARSSSVVWVDYDEQKADKPFPHQLFNTVLRPYLTIVESGSPENFHGYIRLTKRVSCTSLRLLNFAFAQLLGGDDKWSDEALLRLPGTFNPKATARRPVTITQHATDTIFASALLKILLDHTEEHVTKDFCVWATREKTSGRTLTEVEADIPSLLARVKPHLASMIRRNQSPTGGLGDESQQLYNFLRDLYKGSDLDEDEAYTLLQTYDPFMDRLGHRAAIEVSKVWYEGETTPARKTERDKFIVARSRGKDESKAASTRSKSQILLDGTDAAKAQAFAEQMVDAIPDMYRAGSVWCIVRPGEDGDPVIKPLDSQTLISQAHRYTDLYTYSRDKKTGEIKEDDAGEPITKPTALNANTAAIALKDVEIESRYLRGLSALPCVIRPDGTLFAHQGYDPQSKLYFTQAKPVDIPEQPTSHDIAEAKRFIFDMVLADVKWATKGDLANYFSMLMTPVLRHYIGLDSHVPAAGIDANNSGSGKGLLFDIIANVNPANSMQFTTRTTELDKNIPTVLGSASAVVRIDNVSEAIKHDRFCELFTSPGNMWTARKFGSNTEQLKLRNDKLWVFTGNNLRFEGDMRSRVVVARLKTEPNPELRKDFVLPNLIDDITNPDFQLAIYRALVILALGWINAGAPEVRREHRSFTRWMSIMGGLCKHYELSGFMDNLTVIRGNDTETNDMAIFLGWWYEEFGSTPVNVRNLIESSKASFSDDGNLITLKWAANAWLDNEFEEILKTKGSAGVQLGKKLERHLDGRFGPYTLTKHPRKVNNRSMYVVKKAK